jgi:hypothetical protein
VACFNNESGLADHGHSMVRYGVGKGGSDLLCVVKPSGRLVALEVKTGNATPDKAQRLFLALINKMGGHAVVVHSVQEAMNAVNEAVYTAGRWVER